MPKKAFSSVVVPSGQKRKNVALLMVLVALIVLIYAITLMRMGGA